MDLYRRMAAIRTEEDSEDLIDEIVDRYGDPPKAVMNLVAIALLRADASAAGISKIEQKGDQLQITMEQLNFPAVSAVCAEASYKRRIFFSAGGKAHADLRLQRTRIPSGRRRRWSSATPRRCDMPLGRWGHRPLRTAPRAPL